MNDWEFVLQDGTIDAPRVKRIEPLTERASALRVVIDDGGMERSFVHKPVKSAAPIEREIWLQETLLPLLPTVSSPRLLTYHINHELCVYWMILEDMGPLTHRFDGAAKTAMAELAAHWHSLPAFIEPGQESRFLPLVDEVRLDIRKHCETYRRHMLQAGLEPDTVHEVFRILDDIEMPFPTEYVLSHGDLHPRNVELTAQRALVLDWEFIQRNSVFWDLYLCMDRAMPNYRINPSADGRMSVLEAYVRARSSFGWVAPTTFYRDYHRFALIYSVNVLPLLNDDLERGSYPKEDLEAERAEILSTIQDCVRYITK